MGDLEYIPISGTRYDNGCDRASTTGCKGVKMWVVKGANYRKGEDTAWAEKAPVAVIKALGNLSPLPDFTDPSASHKSDIAAILSPPTPSYDVSASAPSFTDSGEVNVAATDTSADAGQMS